MVNQILGGMCFISLSLGWSVISSNLKEVECNYSYIIYKLVKVSLQINLRINPSNSSYIFWLDVNFENLTVELYVLIISFIIIKFQEDQKSITWGIWYCGLNNSFQCLNNITHFFTHIFSQNNNNVTRNLLPNGLINEMFKFQVFVIKNCA